MLRIDNLSVRYGDTHAVRDLGLALGAGEIVSLVGPTGCGKTSVLRVLAGLIRPAAGEIRIGRLHITPAHHVPPEKRRVGLVFQDFALFPHLNVEDNIAFRLKDRAPAERWIKQLGLHGHRHALPDTLSGGQKQRVALARALAHKPALLLLDEPLASLDAALKTQLRWEVREALKAAGVPAIWVTHDQTEALSVGDRMGIMRDGRIEQLDAPDVCFGRPATRFVAEFMGEAAFLPGRGYGVYAQTALGSAPSADALGEEQRVDVLVRPDDLTLEVTADGDSNSNSNSNSNSDGDGDGDGNSRVEWSRYEGETRLYGVRLYTGAELRVRTNHETALEAGTIVDTRICARHSLAMFSTTDARQVDEKPVPDRSARAV